MYRHGPNCLQGPLGPISLELGTCTWTTLVSPRPFSRRPPEDAPIRTDLVERVRREIAEGTYDTPEKWQTALAILLDQLQAE